LKTTKFTAVRLVDERQESVPGMKAGLESSNNFDQAAGMIPPQRRRRYKSTATDNQSLSMILT
jgi:hypothetical protein